MILLASKSPRRRQLLSHLGVPFRVVDVDVDEVVAPGTPLELVAANIALQKAKGYTEPLADDEVLLTADTVVVHRGRVLGKPRDAAEAHSMLRSLSDDSHIVYSGVCLKSNSRQRVFTETTTVFFRHLDDEVINRYIEEGACFDKAGAYGAQEWIGMVAMERIEGCFYNVMGLPVSRLFSELKTFLAVR